jgi:hypothetical protein
MIHRRKASHVLIPLALLLLTMSIGQAQSLIIPQIADGGGWLTTLVVGNTTSFATTASISFFQDIGAGATQSWSPSFLEGGSTQNLPLPAGGTVFLHTTGTATTTTQGWGSVQAPAGVIAFAIFTQRVAGRPDQDGTSPAAPSVTRVLMPYDNTNSFVTSMAIVNTTSSSEFISVALQPTSAAGSTATPISLPAQGHMAFTVPQQFSGTGGQSGMLEFYVANGSFSVLALRFNPTGSFTTAPVFPETGPPSIVPNVPINISGLWGGASVGGKASSGSAPSGSLILALSQTGPAVTGTFQFTSVNGALSSGSITGSVLGSVFSFSSNHYFDNTGCGSQLTAGSAQITGVSMQGNVTVNDDMINACGSGPFVHAPTFSAKQSVEEYCGTYGNAGVTIGVVIFLVAADGTVTGSSTPTDGHSTGAVFSGTLTGNALSVTNGVLTTLTGTVSNGVVSGAYGSGTFSASTTGCQ